jgi:hypothetical protein
MLPVLLTVWHHIYAIAADPAWDSTLLFLIILAEIHAIYHDRIQTAAARSQVQIAHQTYELYKQYFETTEKRKADWREAQRRSRAAKKERLAAPEPEPVPEIPPEEPVPPPTDGQVPPLVLPEEGDPEEQQ